MMENYWAARPESRTRVFDYSKTKEIHTVARTSCGNTKYFQFSSCVYCENFPENPMTLIKHHIRST